VEGASGRRAGVIMVGVRGSEGSFLGFLGSLRGKGSIGGWFFRWVDNRDWLVSANVFLAAASVAGGHRRLA
jgi:hypothetical protein